MLPFTKEQVNRFIVALEAKSCENRKDFMKEPPLICDFQARTTIFTAQADLEKAKKHIEKIKEKLKKDINVSWRDVFANDMLSIMGIED